MVDLFTKMTQSRLVGKERSSRKVEGATKPLKISVPKFDNTTLIEGYANILIGRCMNPSHQDMKGLILMLPKFWKMEKHVIGADLRLGRFQFDFVNEEDIEEDLKLQPYHFDY